MRIKMNFIELLYSLAIVGLKDYLAYQILLNCNFDDQKFGYILM